ncbi:MAG: (Fe-S)-binding protein [Deltaproteobacteria bacterium]|nr:MAG: (Fe-S)-binding protein [Deltaproteobacteria bacterium]
MNPVVMGLLLLAALAFFGFTMQHRIRLLLAMRRNEVRWDRTSERAEGLVKFGLGQARMVQKPDTRAGLAHIFIFAGFMVVSIRTITLMAQGFDADFHLPGFGRPGLLGDAYAAVKEVVSVLVLMGVAGFLHRRLVLKTERSEPNLSREALGILAMIAYLMISDLGIDGARIAMGLEEPGSPIGALAAAVYGLLGIDPDGRVMMVAHHFFFWTHVAAVLVFLNFLPLGKHFHVITGLPNVYFKRLGPKAKLKTLDLENEEFYGAAKVDDLHWKNLLDVYSCTECGRCLTHCPTYVTAKPLTHKGLNMAIKRHVYENSEKLIGPTAWRPGLPLVRAAEDRDLPPLNSEEVIDDETAWACTTCGWCEQACPVFIENVPRIVDMRRNLVMVEARIPPELATTFKNVESQSNPWGVAAADRDAWTEQLDFEIPRAGETNDWEYLYYVGCAGAFDDRAKKITLANARIFHEAGVKFAILGKEETCNGDQVRRAGNEYLYQILAQNLIETLNKYEVRKIIANCPHCFNVLLNEYPDLGGHYEVIHHSELIAQLIRDKRIETDPSRWEGGTITYHDACYLGRLNDRYEAPRESLERATGLPVVEMERSGPQSFCCGAGGARMWMEEQIGTRINQERVAEAYETGADVVATACPFCQTMVKDGIAELGHEEEMRTFDVAEIVAETLVETRRAAPPEPEEAEAAE